jgi:hypothetical protein
MHHAGDPRQTAVSEVTKAILYLVMRKFEHCTSAIHAEHRTAQSKRLKF